MQSTDSPGSGAPRRAKRCLAVVLATGLGVVGLMGRPDPAAAQSASDIASAPVFTDEEAHRLIADIKAAADEAERRLRSADSDRLEAEAVLETTDYEADRLLDWVARETRWTPYRGRLRGADGVLMDRRGNSLDRSLLLARLLEDAGHETRLARTTLSQEIAGRLLAEHLRRSVEPSRSGGGDGAPADTKLTELRRRAGSLTERLIELAELGEGDRAGERRALAEAARDHWWVEVRLPSGWTDFDPIFAGSPSVARPEPQSHPRSDELPAEIDHRLTLRVVIERFQEGAVSEETSVELTLPSPQLVLGRHLAVSFIPYSESWSKDGDDAPEQTDLEIAQAADRWSPMIEFGNRTILGEWFSAEGRLVPPPNRWAGAEKLEWATKALGGLGAALEREAPPESHLTAVWLEYAVERPGEPATVARRELVDILGAHRRGASPAARFAPTAESSLSRGLALLGRTVVLPLTCAPAPEAVERAVLELWAANRNPFIAMVYHAAGWEDERVPVALGQVKHRPVDLLAIASARELWSRHADAIFLDRINVLSTHFFLKPEGSGTEFRQAIDLAINSVGVLPLGELDARRARLEQGVVDTLAETALFGDGSSYNPYRLFAAEVEGGSEWRLVESASEIEEFAPGLPAAERARLVEVARAGRRIVASPTLLELAGEPFASWWQIDPEEGTTLGRGYRGWGAEIPEKTIKEILVPNAIRGSVKKFGATTTCKMAIVTADVTMRVAIAKAHAAGGPVKLPVRRFQKACYVLK